MNARVVMHERVVLRRSTDWIEDALHVQQGLASCRDHDGAHGEAQSHVLGTSWHGPEGTKTCGAHLGGLHFMDERAHAADGTILENVMGSSNKHNGHPCAHEQVWVPLRWLTALAAQEMSAVERRCTRREISYTVVTFDGSLTGGGATLQVGVYNIKCAAQAPYVEWMSTRWADEDLQAIDVARGEPSGQARLEALTLTHAVRQWRHAVAASEGRLLFLGDAYGVLQDAVEFRAEDRALNELMGEIALTLAPLGHTADAAHRWSEGNKACDRLRRLKAEEPPSEELNKMSREPRGSDRRIEY